MFIHVTFQIIYVSSLQDLVTRKYIDYVIFPYLIITQALYIPAPGFKINTQAAYKMSDKLTPSLYCLRYLSLSLCLSLSLSLSLVFVLALLQFLYHVILSRNGYSCQYLAIKQLNRVADVIAE